MDEGYIVFWNDQGDSDILCQWCYSELEETGDCYPTDQGDTDRFTVDDLAFSGPDLRNRPRKGKNDWRQPGMAGNPGHHRGGLTGHAASRIYPGDGDSPIVEPETPPAIISGRFRGSGSGTKTKPRPEPGF